MHGITSRAPSKVTLDFFLEIKEVSQGASSGILPGIHPGIYPEIPSEIDSGFLCPEKLQETLLKISKNLTSSFFNGFIWNICNNSYRNL